MMDPPETEACYPGIPAVTDGSGAVVWVETAVTQAACSYPITPSTNMGVDYAQAVADGKRNLWGEPLAFLEPESEHSSASAAEGFALAGGRVVNFTCGQGLVLMKEVLYVISGKRLPMVFDIGARALTSQALNIHCGHDDVMAVADTGWGVLFAQNAQQAADLCLIARRASERSQTPFLNVQDGFLTTHTLENVRLPEPELMREMVGRPADRLPNLFDPTRPLQTGVVQNQDAYMKGRVAQRFFYDCVAGAVEEAMHEMARATGRRYELVDAYRMDDAEYAIVALGSIAETARATVDHLRESSGVRCGVVHPTCFRPFPARSLVEALGRCRAVAVLERTDNPLAHANPLAAELKSALADAVSGSSEVPSLEQAPAVYAGIAGLGGRDVSPADLAAVVGHISAGGRRSFVIGIDHASALEPKGDLDVGPADGFRMRGHSIGGYGSVSTNKVIASVLGDFGLFVQAYPVYGSEKKGLPTTFYLHAAREPIRTHCELAHVDFVPVSSASAFSTAKPLAGLREGGTLFLQSSRTAPEDVWRELPYSARRAIRRRRLRVFHLDAARIAGEVASHPDLQVRMQGIVLLGVFLRVLPRELAPVGEDLFERIAPALRKYVGARGEAIVQENLVCARHGYEELAEIPRPVMLRGIEEEGLALAGKRVAEVMTRDVVSCRPDTPLSRVIADMSTRDVSAVVVTDESNRLRGVLSGTDLRRAHIVGATLESDLPEILPDHLMTRDVITTWPDEPLEDAAHRLFDAHVHRLVVTAGPEDRSPIGILSASDLVALLPEEAE
jgi:pyruvate-ferredoxin/flavodoxin oxidoreductase